MSDFIEPGGYFSGGDFIERGGYFSYDPRPPRPLDRAYRENAAIDLAREWMPVDDYFQRTGTDLSERERALMHLALRCLLDPELVRKRLKKLTVVKA